jgi:hypothetical protein
MMKTTDESEVKVPSRRAIARATVIAFVAALALLFTAVLPAEYGLDPLRTGKALGLTGISQTGRTATTAVSSAPMQRGVFTPQPRIYKVDSEEFHLTPGDGMEMKYHMEKGAGMVYGWKADGNLTFEFHGEPDQKPTKDYYESYELDNKVGKDASYGSFTAPSTGIHGWYFENKTKKDIRFHLTVAGFFDSAKMYTGEEPVDFPVEDAK